MKTPWQHQHGSGDPFASPSGLKLTPTARNEHEHFMRQALAMAHQAAKLGEVPIGAVVVRNGQLVTSAHNWRETWNDPTAHAELIAIREASKVLGGWRLEDCTLYVTLEPCPMCAGAIVLSRIGNVYFGAKDEKGGAVVSKLHSFTPGLWNHDPNFHGGILADECGMILKDFFRGLRNS
ncbi:tRNA adenosine(34) deaminase TadA [Alicyclobacillus mengziensis]|uniref:tRNA-specific adenosine deaminase n=2 Tax=Alicyclobacillus mengziensis TaxID=2931921 RepID=A0A9X7Z7Z7_9BACL|nr:tRNA adenosine(34) deaminase TadA [Alicyclobacillus mengziensis]